MSASFADNLLFGAIIPNYVVTWLTPLWIISVGVAAGMVVLLAAWGIITLINRDAGRRIPGIVREGPLLWIFIPCVLISIFACTAWFIPKEPAKVFTSLARLPRTGTIEKTFTVLPDQVRKANQTMDADADFDAPGQILPFPFNKDDLYLLRLNADDDLIVSAYPEVGIAVRADFAIRGGEETRWLRGIQSSRIFPKDTEEIEHFYAWNPGSEEAQLTITLQTAPDVPQVTAIPKAMISVILVFAIYFILYVLAPKMSAIMLATAKSEMAKPLFWIVMVLGGVALFFSLFIPYNTFGEDIKMMKDSGLTMIKILALVVGFWAAGSSINDEIEGKTALTVLSKPVGRRQFIIGKFLGILCVLAVMFIVLGTLFLVLIAYKPIHNAGETAGEAPLWTDGHYEVIKTIPGLLLGFMEATVLVSISVAISTRLPQLANFIICSSIYVIGNLTPLMIQALADDTRFEPVVFFGKLVATILPVLEHFNMQAAISGGQLVPLSYLFMAGIYCILYSTVAMLLALVLFEDRDLA